MLMLMVQHFHHLIACVLFQHYSVMSLMLHLFLWWLVSHQWIEFQVSTTNVNEWTMLLKLNHDQLSAEPTVHTFQNCM